MIFDPKGVTPGLAPTAQPQEKILNMRCRDEKCPSMEAVEIKIAAPEHTGQRVYRCAKCNHTWSISLGGHIAI